MTTAPDGDGYLALLSSLLDRCDSKASDEDRQTLRIAVYERRTWGPRKAQTPTSVAIRKKADELKPVMDEYTGRSQMPVT